MSKSIVERSFGTTNPYTSNYLNDNLRLARTMIIVSKKEAELYNEFINLKYRKQIDEYNKRSWRYYKHTVGEYHEVDVPMKVISRDNREEIILTKEILEHHYETRNALLEYGEFYDQTRAKYPEQELLLRAIINYNEDSIYNIDSNIDAEDWSIVSYARDLVEKQEANLMHEIQQRIYNYAYKKMLLNYTHVEECYFPLLMGNLFYFIYTSLIGIRLSNVKTSRAHSFHILMYLASHHELDGTYAYLDDYQRMWLYRNLLYLDSHAGREDNLELLVDNLFTRKRVTISNYVYEQLDTAREDLTMEYSFKQTLLNKVKFIHDDKRYDLEGLAAKEIEILKNNRKEYDYNMDDIDYRLGNTLTADTNTKDLEITLTDSSNEVKVKLMDVFIDYWAYTVELDYNNVTIDFINPIDVKSVLLTAKDGFKLFFLTAMRYFELNPKFIPDYEVLNVFKKKIPSTEKLYSKVMVKNLHLKKDIEDTRVRVPAYRYMDTKRSFRKFIEKIYRFELGMWIFISNIGDLYSHHDMENAFSNMHEPNIIHLGEEDTKKFLERIEINYAEYMQYSRDQYMELMNKLIVQFSDDIFEAHEINRRIQDSITKIFSKFKSYSTQVLSNFFISDPTLIDTANVRVSHVFGSKSSTDVLDNGMLGNIRCVSITPTVREWLEYKPELSHGSQNTYLYKLKNNTVVKNTNIIENHYRVGTGLFCLGINEEESTPDSIPTIDDLNKQLK